MPDLKIFKVAIVLFSLFLTAGVGYAGVDDDFGSARKLEGQYFTIYYPPDLDIAELSRQLSVRPSDEVLTGKPAGKRSPAQVQLPGQLDTLFLIVSELLDMRIYSYRGNIKICRDKSQLNRVYSRLFAGNLHHQKSFYVYGLNTVYITADSFTREILGHEIAHAIMSRYFVVQPPVKIQEILAMYVEFQLRNQ